MRKAEQLAWVLAAAVMLLLAGTQAARARIVSGPGASSAALINGGPTADLFCTGGRLRGNVIVSTTEVCVDYNGSLIATGGTANTNQTVGVSSLPWTAVYTSTIQSGNSAQAVSFSPSLSSNTFVTVNPTPLTQTTLVTCYSGSTVTLFLNGNQTIVETFFWGASSVTLQGSTVTVAVLVDGAYVNGATASKGNLAVNTGAAVSIADFNTSFNMVVTGLTPNASHSFCLTSAVTSGSVTVDNGVQVAKFGAVILP